MKATVEMKNAETGQGKAGVLRWVRRAWRRFPGGLSERLFALTFIFVLMSGFVINLVSLEAFRTEILNHRIDAAQLAALALEASNNQAVAVDLSEELLANAGVISVVLKRNDERSLFLSPGQMPVRAAERYNLENRRYWHDFIEAIELLGRKQNRIISVQGVPRLEGGSAIETLMYEAPIRSAMLERAGSILAMSFAISIFIGFCVYGAIYLLLVRPLLRIERAMTRFRAAPEDVDAIIQPSERSDEVGRAERELAAMQADLRLALRQQMRLAALGTAVSKINHDLRNILSSAQLFVDRLEKSEDPFVQRLAPKLVSAIDRAVHLCTNTLLYGKADEAPPELQAFDLWQLVEDVAINAAPVGRELVHWSNDVGRETFVVADPEQMFRVLLNLARNAAEAIVQQGQSGTVQISAKIESNFLIIDIADTGPGLPPTVRERLFEAFVSSGRSGGTGLGLAIAADLVRAHGGEITLKSTGESGSVFRIRLPRKAP